MHPPPARLHPRPRELRARHALADQRHRATEAWGAHPLGGEGPAAVGCGHGRGAECETEEREGVSELGEGGGRAHGGCEGFWGRGDGLGGGEVGGLSGW